MLKKIVDVWARLTASWENVVAEALDLNRGGFEIAVDVFFDKVANLSAHNIVLERQLRDARTRASKNGCLALLAFGLIAIEILGVALYFLPK